MLVHIISHCKRLISISIFNGCSERHHCSLSAPRHFFFPFCLSTSIGHKTLPTILVPTTNRRSHFIKQTSQFARASRHTPSDTSRNLIPTDRPTVHAGAPTMGSFVFKWYVPHRCARVRSQITNRGAVSQTEPW